MVEFPMKELLREPAFWALAACLALALGLMIACIWVDAKAEASCAASGGAWVQTGSTTIYTTHKIGDAYVTTPIEIPTYSCQH